MLPKTNLGEAIPPRWLYCVKLTNTNQQNCPFVNLTHKHLTSKSQHFFSYLSPRSHVNIIILKSLLWKSHSLYNFQPGTQIHHYYTITFLIYPQDLMLVSQYWIQSTLKVSQSLKISTLKSLLSKLSLLVRCSFTHLWSQYLGVTCL